MQILYKNFAGIVQILSKLCANIVLILYIFCANFFQEIVHKMFKIFQNCSNIVQILCKYCANIVQILRKCCANIAQMLRKCCANIAQILRKYCAYIVQILIKQIALARLQKSENSNNNHQGTEGHTFCVLSRVALQLKKKIYGTIKQLFLLKEIRLVLITLFQVGLKKLPYFMVFEYCYCSYRPRELLNSKINISSFSQVFQLKILIL